MRFSRLLPVRLFFCLRDNLMSIRVFGGLIPENVVRAATDAVTGEKSFLQNGQIIASGVGKVAVGTCVLLGDSRNDQHSTGTVIAYGNKRTKSAVHWLNWYNALSNQPINVLAKYAVSNTQTSDLAGQVASVLALPVLPQFAFIWTGVNDWSGSVTASVAASNIADSCYLLGNAGITPVVFSESGTTAMTSVASITWLFEFNERLRDLADNNRKILLFDTGATLWDPSAATWSSTPVPNFKAGYLTDATHPGNLGGYNLGVAFGTWFSGRVTPFESRSSVLGEMVFANNPLALIANGLFTTTTGGTSSGSGAVVGNVPASWNLAKGAAGSSTTISASAGSHGNDLSLVMTTGGADTIKLTQDVAAGPKAAAAIGDILQAGAEIVVSAGTNLQGVNCIHEYNDGSASYTYIDLYCQVASAGNGPQAYTATLQPFPMTLSTTPSGWITTRLEWVFSGAGGATTLLRRAKFRKRIT